MNPTTTVAPRSQRSISLEGLAEILRERNNYLIVSHMRPDGDCLGSTMGLYHGLVKLGKKVAAYNATPLVDKWSFIPGVKNVLNELPGAPFDITIFVDCGGVSRVSDDFSPTGTTINIDHHLTNDRFADYNYIDIDACAVGEQIFDLLKMLDVPITAEIASCLYLSILTDTGGFRYSNTSSEALRVAGELVAAGAAPGVISQAVYETREKGEFMLTARALSRLRYEMDDAIVWSELFWKDYEECGGIESEPEGLVSEMRGVRGVEVSCLLHETDEGWLRVGFRGKGQVDCSAIAQACGGGGHFNASGAAIKNMKYAEAKEIVLAEVRKGVQAWKTQAGVKIQ
ncbi:bifunctional oligoribonuclease/PAP phosphatase NrnA [Candidatus Sumerlaeota bacterium]|nr:bifunctional oligoribonuclease/PAP phosphatase NrnA [Candidatus Sumerlaeota bacterium]